MGVIDRIRGWFTPPAVTVEKATEPVATTPPEGVAFDQMLRLMGQTGKYSALTKPTKVSFNVLRGMSRANAIVRICVDTLKRMVAKTDWDVVPIDERADASTNKEQIEYVKRLIKRPNKNNESFRTLMDKTVEDILVLDQAAWELVRDRRGMIAEIYTLDGATIRPVYDIHGQFLNPAYLQYLPNNFDLTKPNATFSLDDLIVMMQNPQTDTNLFGYGFSPVEAVILSATNYLNADMYQGGIFEKGTFTNKILNLGENVADAQVKAFREYWKTEIEGRPYSLPIIGGAKGPEIVNLGDSPKDAQFMEYVQWLARIIVGAMGLSPQDIGLNLDQYKAEGEVQANISQKKGYMALLDTIQEYLNQELIWEGLGEVDPTFKELKFTWIDIDDVNEKERAEIAKIEVGMGLRTINEYRTKELGLDPVEGGDAPLIITGKGAMTLEQALNAQDLAADATTASIETDQSSEDQPETKKSLKARPIVGDYSFIDEDHIEHPFGKEVTYVAVGERITRKEYGSIKKVFQQAAELAHTFMPPLEIERRTGLRNLEFTKNLKEAIDRVNLRLKDDAHGARGIINHFQKFGATIEPVYGVYDLYREPTVEYDIRKQRTLAPRKGKLDELADQLTDRIQRQLVKLYPVMKRMVTKLEKQNSDDSLREQSLEFGAQDEPFLIEIDKEDESILLEAAAVGLAAGAVGLMSRAPDLMKPRVRDMINEVEVDQFRDLLRNRSLEMAKSVAQTLKDGAQKLITRMVDQGKGTDEIARQLKEFLGFDKKWRAARIARTEIAWASSRAAGEQAAKAGTTKKRWIKGLPDAEPICVDNVAAGWVPVDSSFPSGDLLTPAHPNCACSIEYGFE